MRTRKIRFTIVGVLLVMFLVLMSSALSACTPTDLPLEGTGVAPVGTDLSQYQNDKPFRMIATNQEVPVVKIMLAGFLQACDDYGLDCVVMGVNGNDIAKSVELAEQSVALGSSGLLTTIYDAAWYAPTLKAIEAGIPVINGHFPMDKTLIPGLGGWVAPDNEGYAIEAARVMAEKISCSGKVAITQSTLSDGENAVSQAFIDEMKVVCPALEVLDVQIETTDPDKAIAVTSAIIQGNESLTGAFSTTGGGATAWAKSAKEVGLEVGKLVIIGMDASRENLDLLKSGEVYALVAQPLYAEMYQAVTLLLETNMGMPVPYENVLPAPIIMKDDVDPYYVILERAEAIK
jgi:ribose transport system substrate-binding protein